MKQILLSGFIVFAGLSAAQAEEPAPGLIERGAQMFLKGLIQQLQPALRDLDELSGSLEPALRSFTTEMAPYLRDLLQQVDDWSVYEAPEVLPNGDIILRKKISPPNVAPQPEKIDI